MGRKKTIDNEKILDAAGEVTLELGAARLSLDAVAKRAGISKSGLLYSFPSKEELIEALFIREMSRFEVELQKELPAFGDSRYARLFARIVASKHETPNIRAKAASIMATISQMPEHVHKIRQAYANDIALLAGPEKRKATFALVAIEGVFLVRGLGLIELSADEWSAIFDDIEKLIPASKSSDEASR